MTEIITDLNTIKKLAEEKELENDDFLSFIKSRDGVDTDQFVHRLNKEVSDQIDCTQCGNCCRSLMINVAPGETKLLATKLGMTTSALKAQYIEESEQGKMIINTIPCHFLADNRCTIYEDRFVECREFPHLHKPNFSARLTGTLQYYPMCPIIFNVVEKLKSDIGFKIAVT